MVSGHRIWIADGKGQHICLLLTLTLLFVLSAVRLQAGQIFVWFPRAQESCFTATVSLRSADLVGLFCTPSAVIWHSSDEIGEI